MIAAFIFADHSDFTSMLARLNVIGTACKLLPMNPIPQHRKEHRVCASP